jgi:hypothetical protein
MLISVLTAESAALHLLYEREPPQPFAAIVLGHARYPDLSRLHYEPEDSSVLAL